MELLRENKKVERKGWALKRQQITTRPKATIVDSSARLSRNKLDTMTGRKPAIPWPGREFWWLQGPPAPQAQRPPCPSRVSRFGRANTAYLRAQPYDVTAHPGTEAEISQWKVHLRQIFFRVYDQRSASHSPNCS